MKNDLFNYTLRQADNVMILCQRLCQWVAKAPELEEDIAMTNIALDLIGQARALYQYAAELSEENLTEDDLAYMRDERQWKNVVLVEQPNGDFADTIARQYFFDVWHLAFLDGLQRSSDPNLAAIAAKSIKEVRYHLRHSETWLRRLGDGTDYSHERMQNAVDKLWPFTHELFTGDELDQRLLSVGIAVDLQVIKTHWLASVTTAFRRATLDVPAVLPQSPLSNGGGRQGLHSQHMGYLLAEMQILPRSMPGCQW